jgi:hypothetical protein
VIGTIAMSPMDSSALILIDDESDHAVDPECLEPERRRRRRADSREGDRPVEPAPAIAFVAKRKPDRPARALSGC